jgi:ATP-dependent DNA helicase DinG
MVYQQDKTAKHIISIYPALGESFDGLWLAKNGTVAQITRGKALSQLAEGLTLVLNTPLLSSHLGAAHLPTLELLELYAFVRPAQFCVPTPRGLARALGLPVPLDGAQTALFLHKAAQILIDEVASPTWPAKAGAYAILQALRRLKWPWATLLEPFLAKPARMEPSVYLSLTPWEEVPARPPAHSVTLDPAAIESRLAQLVTLGAEQRPTQQSYAQAVAYAFEPRRMQAAPNVLLAEAGTGTGKTLGYLAPASLWVQESNGVVWLSTYTKALQRQLDQELGKLYPDNRQKARAVVLRKGRENYVCLLNLEDATSGVFTGQAGIFAQLVERWARFTRDGDMVGGDFPAWLLTLFGSARLSALTDRRGECVYAACPHYQRCFIEHASRKAQQASFVVANHALVLSMAVRQGLQNLQTPHLIFDEGHQLFDVADQSFALALTAQEGLELRQWFLGPQTPLRRGRRRGLEARLADYLLLNEAAQRCVQEICRGCLELPGADWLSHITQGSPQGAFEEYLVALRDYVYARASSVQAGFSLEAALHQLPDHFIHALGKLASALERIVKPVSALEEEIRQNLEAAPDWLDLALRPRLEAMLNGLKYRREKMLAWVTFLVSLPRPSAKLEGEDANLAMVDWASLERVEGRELDLGLRRHWLDPTKALAQTVFEPAHGVVITSATLIDRFGPAEQGWAQARAQTGAQHLALPAQIFAAPSPFDYKNQARVLIVTDVRRGDISSLAAAYLALIKGAKGGALGLFTAISRLKAVHAKLYPALAKLHLPLLAQHVDPIDTGTLVDMFRAEPNSSLLGTDALRDGVDAPGDTLRLVILEGVPWPRPSLLHSARRTAFGGAAYDDRLTRAKLAQAFGRLIRRQSDRGVFVLLGAGVPSRLLKAFPEEVVIERVTLEHAVSRVQDWLMVELGARAISSQITSFDD